MRARKRRRALSASVGFFLVACLVAWGSASRPYLETGERPVQQPLVLSQPWNGEISGDRVLEWSTPVLDPRSLYAFSFSVDPLPLEPDHRYRVALVGAGVELEKTLHTGDPGVFVTVRPRKEGPAVIRLQPALGSFRQEENRTGARLLLRRMEVPAHQQTAFESEPNDTWQEANPLVLGQPLFGGTDDVEYLDNLQEYQAGWDWFRIDFSGPDPQLVYFELDLPDRDIPVQLLFYRYNPETGRPEEFTAGKDPMEILHDGQKIRYSKFITRVLSRGRYYLAVLGNHPFYVLRSTLYPVPPYQDPSQAVETAMHYMLGIGDAWLAQIPRLGSRHRRSIMLHDEAQRCTACHPTVFPLESNLTAFRNGYPIRAKSQFRYLMERVYNAPTPLYGNPGVTWVRFVAILLQFFGKQGGTLIDYENLVTGQPTPWLDRFTGFLQTAWDHRDSLPEDENNGVSPIDSKFGFAWRDWRVLDEKARRSQDPDARASADHIESLLADPASLARIEGTQDRLHRLHGLALMNPARYRNQIREGVHYFLRLQNPDGGWPGNEEKPSGGLPLDSLESAEYLTGQVIHTLLTAGVDPKGRKQLEKGARWLLSRQRDFGGWFQTDTIENFVTPMRETRYAIMALSSLYPRGERATGQGLGNRNEEPARLPSSDSLVTLLRELDNLWTVESSRREEFALWIQPLLQHEDSFVRALAAQALGRIGHPGSAEALAECLKDPDKMVWQSAAWALRQLGNQGNGLEVIRMALQSPNPATRRGATRIFAYQFYGMDQQEDLLESFFPLLEDPDLLTRHQAARTLAQWWYRTSDREARQRIVEGLVHRLSREPHPLQNFNLSQALYTLLDENLGSPGTGYGRWIAYFPKEQQEALRAERRWQEEHLLLKPILKALREGSPQQRLGVLMAFDGTPFWRGYTTAAFGPGNDRSFEFEQGTEFQGLQEALAAVLSRRDRPRELSYGLRLAAFFDAFSGSYSRRLVPLYLSTLNHADSEVREAALDVADRVSLDSLGVEAVPLLQQLSRSAETGEAVKKRGAFRTILQLLRKHPALLQEDSMAELVRDAMKDPELAALAVPLLASPAFSEEEALKAFQRFWPASLPTEEETPEAYQTLVQRNSLLSERVLERTRRQLTAEPPEVFRDCLQLLDKRPSLLDRPPVLMRLSGAARVDNGRVRQLIFELLLRHPSLATHRLLAPQVQGGLMDIRAEVRRAALQLAALHPSLLEFEEADDYLLLLLVDRDSQVRRLALEVVAGQERLRKQPKLAGRVKVLEREETGEEVRARAAAVLREAGLDPSRVPPSGSLSRPAQPDYEFFRTRVNPFFYQELDRDGRACANCHATHRILRLAEPPAPGGTLSEESLRENYQALLRVIDVDDPEGSLVLRKPLSPSGQGEEDLDSPTGLTHVGGTRWSGPEHPAYQTILQWIRTASSHPERVAR